MKGGNAKPTEDMIALVAFLLGGPWLAADEIRHGIARLGFEMPSSQWVTGRLVAMCRESAPRFERIARSWGITEYRVTGWAACGLENEWDGYISPAVLPHPQLEGLAKQNSSQPPPASQERKG
jgi:hypothetical protein